MTPAEVSEGLGLDTLKNRQWSIHKACAIKGEGLEEGLDWCVLFLSLTICRIDLSLYAGLQRRCKISKNRLLPLLARLQPITPSPRRSHGHSHPSSRCIKPAHSLATPLQLSLAHQFRFPPVCFDTLSSLFLSVCFAPLSLPS